MIALSHPRSTSVAMPAMGDLISKLERWAEQRRQRRALLALDDNLLKDIGLNPADAWREGTKPFWQA